MIRKQGFTLFEIVIVIVIIGVCVALTFPNYNTPMEQAKASNAQNNLLALYSAERNYYNNNNGSYYVSSHASSLAALNTAFSLNILDDGTYNYDCGFTTANVCTATRNDGAATADFYMRASLLAPIQLGGTNPSCWAISSKKSWCPGTANTIVVKQGMGSQQGS